MAISSKELKTPAKSIPTFKYTSTSKMSPPPVDTKTGLRKLSFFTINGTRYEVNPTPVAKGSIGQVFLAKSAVGEFLAVKKLHPEYHGSDCFFKEAECLLDVDDFAALAGEYPSAPEYLVMKWKHGKPLHQIILNIYSSTKLIRMMIKIFEKQIYLNEKGWIHHDIKEDNVLYDEKKSEAHSVDHSLSAKIKGPLVKGFNIFKCKQQPPEASREHEAALPIDAYGAGILLEWAMENCNAQLNDTLKTKLTSICNSLRAFNPTNRMTLKTAVEELKKLHKENINNSQNILQHQFDPVLEALENKFEVKDEKQATAAMCQWCLLIQNRESFFQQLLSGKSFSEKHLEVYESNLGTARKLLSIPNPDNKIDVKFYTHLVKKRHSAKDTFRNNLAKFINMDVTKLLSILNFLNKPANREALLNFLGAEYLRGLVTEKNAALLNRRLDVSKLSQAQACIDAFKKNFPDLCDILSEEVKKLKTVTWHLQPELDEDRVVFRY